MAQDLTANNQVRGIVSQISQCGITLQMKTDMTFPKTGPKKILVSCSALMNDGADLQKAIQLVERSMQPASKNQLTAWIAELSIITKRRQESANNEALTLMAYTKRLQAYPAYVAHEALITRTYHFWPSWDEL